MGLVAAGVRDTVGAGAAVVGGLGMREVPYSIGKFLIYVPGV